MSVIVGVDPSSRRVAMVAHHLPTATFSVLAVTLYKTGSQTIEAIHRSMVGVRDFVTQIQGLCGTTTALYAYVETPMVGRGSANIGAVIKQAYVGGVVRACLVDAGFTVYDISPSTWKAHLGIRPNKDTKAAKADAATAIHIRWPKIEPLVSGDIDLVDAAGICLYGTEQSRKAGILAGPAGHAASVVQRRRRKSVAG